MFTYTGRGTMFHTIGNLLCSSYIAMNWIVCNAYELNNSNVQVGDEVTIIDATGKFVMPGRTGKS